LQNKITREIRCNSPCNMLSRKQDSHKHLIVEIQTLLTIVNEFLPAPSTYLGRLGWNFISILTKFYWTIVSIVEVGGAENILHSKA